MSDQNADGDVRLKVEEQIATVTISRVGKKNALSLPMWGQLCELLQGLGRRDDVRVVVVDGDGADFCSGADLWTRSPDGPPPHSSHAMRLLTESAAALHQLPQPSVAVVRGSAVGAGCNLALGCDFVIADTTARFSEIFTVRGVTPDFAGTWLLPRLVGLRRAMEMSLLGDFVGAEEALQLGLINRVAEPDDLAKVASALVVRLAAGPPIANAQTKRLINSAFDTDFRSAVEAEAAVQSVNFRTADTKEALRAFTERRDPRFEGR